jgi:hypothetical protein
MGALNGCFVAFSDFDHNVSEAVCGTRTDLKSGTEGRWDVLGLKHFFLRAMSVLDCDCNLSGRK